MHARTPVFLQLMISLCFLSCSLLLLQDSFNWWRTSFVASSLGGFIYVWLFLVAVRCSSAVAGVAYFRRSFGGAFLVQTGFTEASCERHCESSSWNFQVFQSFPVLLLWSSISLSLETSLPNFRMHCSHVTTVLDLALKSVAILSKISFFLCLPPNICLWLAQEVITFLTSWSCQVCSLLDVRFSGWWGEGDRLESKDSKEDKANNLKPF